MRQRHMVLRLVRGRPVGGHQARYRRRSTRSRRVAPSTRSTYVRVYDSTPTTVVYGYTPGYLGSYVYGPTVIYGTGYYYTPWYGTRLLPAPGHLGLQFSLQPVVRLEHGLHSRHGWPVRLVRRQCRRVVGSPGLSSARMRTGRCRTIGPRPTTDRHTRTDRAALPPGGAYRPGTAHVPRIPEQQHLLVAPHSGRQASHAAAHSTRPASRGQHSSGSPPSGRRPGRTTCIRTATETCTATRTRDGSSVIRVSGANRPPSRPPRRPPGRQPPRPHGRRWTASRWTGSTRPGSMEQASRGTSSSHGNHTGPVPHRVHAPHPGHREAEAGGARHSASCS